MKINAIILDKDKSGQFFGYIKQFPSVCAQADTMVGVNNKLRTYLKLHIDYLSSIKKFDIEDQLITA